MGGVDGGQYMRSSCLVRWFESFELFCGPGASLVRRGNIQQCGFRQMRMSKLIMTSKAPRVVSVGAEASPRLSGSRVLVLCHHRRLILPVDHFLPLPCLVRYWRSYTSEGSCLKISGEGRRVYAHPGARGHFHWTGRYVRHYFCIVRGCTPVPLAAFLQHSNIAP